MAMDVIKTFGPILLGLLGIITVTIVIHHQQQEFLQRWVHPVVDPAGPWKMAPAIFNAAPIAWVGIGILVLIAGLCALGKNSIALVFLAGITVPTIILTAIPNSFTAVDLNNSNVPTTQAAFDQWSAARYGIDTSALDPEQKSTLMWLSMFRDASPLVKLPGTGQLVSMTRIDGNDLYLITGNTEVPVLGTADTVTANK